MISYRRFRISRYLSRINYSSIHIFLNTKVGGDVFKVTEHPLCFQRVKWERNSLLFGISTDSTLYFGRVEDLEGLADKDDLDLGDLAAVTVVRVDGICDFAFSPDERVVAVGTLEGTVYFIVRLILLFCTSLSIIFNVLMWTECI
jgi:hypothetical protein